MSKISPCLWFESEAEEAAKFYVSIFPDSRVNSVSSMPADSPSGPAGSVKIVAFELFGRSFTAMSAGRLDPFNHAVSFMVSCDNQAEVDRYWEALLAGGGKPKECGWLEDRYGLHWQVVPRVLLEMMSAPDREAGKRAAQAMMGMVKLDIAALQAAFEGK